MDVNIVWGVRDMRSNVRTVCMLYIVYAITSSLYRTTISGVIVCSIEALDAGNSARNSQTILSRFIILRSNSSNVVRILP